MTDRVVLSLLDQPPDDDPQPSGALTLPVPDGWPAPPDPTVYHGLVGEIVNTIAPQTEADPVAILSQLLVAFGAAVGRGAWFQVEATRHHPNEFLVLIGDSARARKGSSWDHVHRLITGADPAITARILTGLSQRGGADPLSPRPRRPRPRRQRPAAVGDRTGVRQRAEERQPRDLDPVADTPLGVGRSPVGDPDPDRARARHRRAHHVIGHITATELQHHINPVELANGLLNRFLLLGCRRVRLLPEGGDPDPLRRTGLDRRLATTLNSARRAGQIRLSAPARRAWADAYQQLAEPQPGIAGAISARAEAHTIRLALIYALLDTARQIQPAHLTAALALWDYALRSATWALERTTGDPLAHQIHAALTHALPGGLTRTQLRDLLHRNPTTAQLDRALAALAHDGKITSSRVLTAGRPAELWTATQP